MQCCKRFVGLVILAALFAGSRQTGQAQQKKLSNEDKFGLIMKAIPDSAPVKPKQPRRILIFSRTMGFRHDSIPFGIKAITMMGDKTGAYTALATEDESMFEPQKLAKFDAVLMLNTTGDCLRQRLAKDASAEDKQRADQREDPLKKSLRDFVAGGKGLIGVHSATDTYHKWKDYNVMMGGTFVAHPWNAGDKVGIKNVDPTHAINASFDGKDFEIVDEIYMFRDDTARPNERRYLLTLDPSKTDMTRGKRKDGTYPIAWVSTFGKGHTFYCSLGHNQHIYWNPMILRHYLAGIQYALGDLEADATPRPSKSSE